ncbi:MAG: DUF5343 domain-containing protein [Nitrososphaera sp.]|nr:DUF5343 domain-containing protein [Nitrososphaera sp.]
MADKHPYVQAPGNLVQVMSHLRKSFPSTMTAETLKKLGFAPKNESYVLNVLRFIGLIDDAGKKTETAGKVFSQHNDATFQNQFSDVIKSAYSDLFSLHGDNTWTLNTESLVTFFRSTDHTTGLVGKHQARTFQVLAGFSGHQEIPEPRAAAAKGAAKVSKKKPRPKAEPATSQPEVQGANLQPAQSGHDIGLTVRIEINLPADADQDTYDRIFRSIRENLLNGRTVS